MAPKSALVLVMEALKESPCGDQKENPAQGLKSGEIIKTAADHHRKKFVCARDMVESKDLKCGVPRVNIVEVLVSGELSVETAKKEVILNSPVAMDMVEF